jgi:hypothetical protein
LSESGGLMDGIHNILKAAFAEDQFLLKKRNFWLKKMYEILVLFQISSTINSKSFNKKIEDFYKDKLKSELCRIKQNNSASGKLRFYSKNIGDFELQRYLKLNDISKDLRRMLTTLRISAHSLAIETGRYGTKKYQLVKDFVNSAPQMWKMRCIFFFSVLNTIY